MTTADRVETLFENGPIPHFQKSLTLFRPLGVHIAARATFLILVGWFPLIPLVIAQDFRSQTALLSFLVDFGVHARSLIAAPLLIVSEIICRRRLEEIAVHFVRSGIVEEQDRARFKSLAVSTRSLMSSTLAEIVAIALAYAMAFGALRYAGLFRLAPWYLVHGEGIKISWAGWWYALVSLPLLLILFFAWFWRVIVWSRFLIKVSRFKLSLIASHPDKASGLKFLNSSLFAFMPVAFTIGVVAAGSMANKVAYQGATIEAIQKTVGGVVIFVLVLFVGPLFVFVYKLQRQKIAGVFSYGALAENVGRQFEQKWLANYDKHAEEALEASDFSATTDLYQVVANVHDMKVLPFDLFGLVSLAAVTLIPFIPVVIMMMPLKEILQAVAGLLI